MGVYIPNMEMPEMPESIEQGEAVPFVDVRIFADGTAVISKGERPYFTQYTAVPVPPHGDLIDRDAFVAMQRHLYCENCARRKGMKNGKMRFVYDIGDAPCRACDIDDVLDSLEDYAPTIIPAEEVKT